MGGHFPSLSHSLFHQLLSDIIFFDIRDFTFLSWKISWSEAKVNEDNKVIGGQKR